MIDPEQEQIYPDEADAQFGECERSERVGFKYINEHVDGVIGHFHYVRSIEEDQQKERETEVLVDSFTEGSDPGF